MKKITFAIIFSLVLILTVLTTILVFAEEPLPNGTCGTEGNESSVTWALTENDIAPVADTSTPNAGADAKYYTLTISGEGAMAENAHTQWRNYLTHIGQTSKSTVRGNGSQTFYNITKIVVEEGVTSISGSAFANTMVSELDLGSVQKIGGGVFLWVNWLENITIPATVTNLNYDEATEQYYNTFDGAFYLKSINVESGNAAYKVDNGMLLGKIADTDNWMIVNCPDNLDGVTLISKSGFTEPNITLVGRTAFGACRNLEQIELPDTITSISIGSFNKCYALASFTMPNSLLEFGGDFRACRSLASVDFNNVTSVINSSGGMFGSMTPAEIGETTAVDCPFMTSLDLSNITNIGGSAFKGNPNITSVTFYNMEDGLLNIGVDAFKGCGFGSATFDFSLLSDESTISMSAFDDDVNVILPIVSVDKAVAGVKDTSNQYTYYKLLHDAIADADATDTVVLFKDVDLTTYINIAAGDTLNLDLNGHILRQTGNARVFWVYGNLIISDSNPDAVHYYTVDNTRGGIWVVDDTNTSGNVLKGGVITGGKYSSTGGAINAINNGYVKLIGGNVVGNMVTSASTLAGGIGGKKDIFGGSVMGNVLKNSTNDTYTISDINNGTVYGGTFTTEIKPAWCADLLYPYDNGDGTYTVSDVLQNAEASIGETQFVKGVFFGKL